MIRVIRVVLWLLGLSVLVSPLVAQSSRSLISKTKMTTTTSSPRKMLTKSLKPFDTKDIKVLLLEGLNKTGQDILNHAGYQVEAHLKALDLEILKEKIKDVHAIGIRSKTKLTREVLECAKELKVSWSSVSTYLYTPDRSTNMYYLY